MAAPRLRTLARAALASSCAWAACGLLACSGDERRPPPAEGAAEPAGEARPGPATAKWEVVDSLREARALDYHPSDGGGRAWLESAEPERPSASGRGRFRIAFEVGSLGIATGGAITLQVSPFWGWSTPQVEASDAPG